MKWPRESLERFCGAPFFISEKEYKERGVWEDLPEYKKANVRLCDWRATHDEDNPELEAEADRLLEEEYKRRREAIEKAKHAKQNNQKPSN